MIWIKWWVNWAWGDTSDTPNYRLLPENEVDEYFEDEVAPKFNWSDKYRGITWEVIDKPSVKWIEREIKYTENKLRYNQNYLETLRSL